MNNKLKEILSAPFLLIQIGDYGHEYDRVPIPAGLITRAIERQKSGKSRYPTNYDLPPPHFHVPSDVHGIIMNKIDELNLNDWTYWAQKLNTRVDEKQCINSSQKELIRFSNITKPFWAVLVKKQTSVAPKGSRPGQIFERWTPEGKYVCDIKTGKINMDVVYTESGKTTLIFDNLEEVSDNVDIDLKEYHVYFTPDSDLPSEKYRGLSLPYRPSLYGGSCSLMTKGKPGNESDIKLLKESVRTIIAIASLHEHVCGRVR